MNYKIAEEIRRTRNRHTTGKSICKGCARFRISYRPDVRIALSVVVNAQADARGERRGARASDNWQTVLVAAKPEIIQHRPPHIKSAPLAQSDRAIAS